ncbi:hypothetical protein ABT093_25360 [Kitasatospora sp. NPDC002551]|uniref:hypothetical protein n=1 Tax=unclassified Kitasatospora TaxID=2633591 RepID=UPI003324D9DA
MPHRSSPTGSSHLTVAAPTCPGLVLVLGWQALRAQPVTALAAPTGAALLALVAAAGAAAVLVLRHARAASG